MELIETSVFTRQITALLSDEEYGAFQSRLAANPGIGALIQHGGVSGSFGSGLGLGASAGVLA